MTAVTLFFLDSRAGCYPAKVEQKQADSRGNGPKGNRLTKAVSLSGIWRELAFRAGCFSTKFRRPIPFCPGAELRSWQKNPVAVRWRSANQGSH